MNLDYLRQVKNKQPFQPFTIHLADGHRFRIKDPEDIAIHPEWTVDVMIFHPGGRFSFVYTKNVTHVTGKGSPPRLRGRRRRGEKKTDPCPN